ncbi:MAG: hypothetical protein RLN89_15640 [Parvibaculum sp.]
MKVTAVEAITGIEVVIAGPVRTAQTELERIALNKLRYVMRQRGIGPLDDAEGSSARSGDVDAGTDQKLSDEGSTTKGGKGWIA